jgi:hypothetical protein
MPISRDAIVFNLVTNCNVEIFDSAQFSAMLCGKPCVYALCPRPLPRKKADLTVVKLRQDELVIDRLLHKHYRRQKTARWAGFFILHCLILNRMSGHLPAWGRTVCAGDIRYDT